MCVLGLLAACGGGGGFPDAPQKIDAEAPNATFSLTWSVTDMASAPVACDAIGAISVTVIAHNLAFLGGTTEVFTCGTGMGMSEKLPPGTWDFDFQLGGPSGVIATVPGQHDVTLTNGQNTELMPLTFAVDPTGGLALTLATNRTDGNCAAQPDGGGITGTTITLEHTGDHTCEPVTFSISGGGTYTVDCANPVAGPCIDSTQTLTVTSVPSDGYTIHVKGYIGATACWSNNDTLQVPSQAQTLTKTLNLAYATTTPGC